MSWIVCGILLIIIILLILKQKHQISIDRSEAEKYQNELMQLKQEKQRLIDDIKENSNALIDDYQNKILEVKEQYNTALKQKTNELNTYFLNQKNLRQSELDDDFARREHEKENNLKLKVQQFEQQSEERIEQIQIDTEQEITRLKSAQLELENITNFQKERFEALLAPLAQYEKEQQERLFYTIQVPDEYKDDINFLITTVSQKVQHPDIINKLVWAEYVKPYIDGTFKRVGVEEKPGIYKLTNLDTGKCYIGKSTNVKKRIADHFKSSIGILTIADQAVHHEIWKTGFWNWTIEVIIYCEKDQLSELEKYYIEFFKSNIFGFNKSSGGEG